VRRRHLAVFAACLAFATASAPAAGSTAVTPRSCGIFSVGIGWHLRATRNVKCSFAKKLTATYFRRGGRARTRLVVLHFVCRQRYLPPNREQIRCLREGRLVTATSSR
jgi:hypothetical protein